MSWFILFEFLNCSRPISRPESPPQAEILFSISPEEKKVEELNLDKVLSKEYHSPEIILNSHVEKYIDYFQNQEKERFSTWLKRSCLYLPIMEQIFAENGLPVELARLALIESGFNPKAVSRARAVGAWQFMRYTGQKYGLRIDEWVDERRDPIKSTYAAARYLKDLYNLFGCWHLAIAAYNAGEGKILKALKKSGVEDFWELVHSPFIRRETKNYVPILIAALLISDEPEEYGFSNIECEHQFEYDTVKVKYPIDLAGLANHLNVSLEELQFLNPELRYPYTPPNQSNYELRIPPGTQQKVEEYLENLPPQKRLNMIHHRVRRGETLSSIAQHYRTSASAIITLNKIKNPHKIKEGNVLLIPLRWK